MRRAYAPEPPARPSSGQGCPGRASPSGRWRRRGLPGATRALPGRRDGARPERISRPTIGETRKGSSLVARFERAESPPLAKRTTTSRKTKKTTTARKAAPKKASAPAFKPHTVTPYLAVADAAGAIEWYKKVCGAKEPARQLAGPKIMHAALRIGDSEVYLSDIFPGSDVQDPSRVGASVTIHVWSPKIDAYWKSAITNGAKVIMPIDNMFWGDRYGQFIDPFGHRWAVNWKAKMNKAEMEAKRIEAMKQMGPQ